VYRGVSRSHSARAGIVVPRYGHTIVQRNRLKRRLREVVRTEWLTAARGETPPPEILIRARPGAYEVDAKELRKAVIRCAGGSE
jgi:ribonuclease P protein component